MSSKTGRRDGTYNINLDLVLLLVALAFCRRGVTNHRSLEKCWLSDQSKLHITIEERLEEPVFITYTK